MLCEGANDAHTVRGDVCYTYYNIFLDSHQYSFPGRKPLLLHFPSEMHRFILLLCALGLLLTAIPSHAFFEMLDVLQEQLEQSQQQGGDTQSTEALQDIVKELKAAPAKDRAGFKDVDAKQWFAPYALYASAKGIMTGYKDKAGKPTGDFGPGDPVTVAQMLKIAFKAAGADESACPATAKHPGAAKHWAKPFVACLEQLGVRLLAGNPPLDRPALRGEVIGLLNDVYGGEVPPIAPPFKDLGDSLYANDIAYAYVLGIVTGDKDKNGKETGTFRPNAGVNRAEAAKITYLKMRQVAKAAAKKK